MLVITRKDLHLTGKCQNITSQIRGCLATKKSHSDNFDAYLYVEYHFLIIIHKFG